MANIGILLPRQTILEYAKRVIEEEQAKVQILKVVDNSNAVMEAQAAIEAGVQIIIARGMQALLIKEYTNIPVVEMPLTTQEIGLLIRKAKRQLRKERPTIAIVGWKNMFTSMEHLEELFDFQLRTYFLTALEDTRETVERAMKEGADLIIGGVKANQIAFELGFPCLFVETREDSIRSALRVAQNMGYAADLEKHNNAQLETILDTSFNGIIKLNAYREIVAVNRMIEDVLEKTDSQVIGFPVEEILPGIDVENIGRLLSGEQEMFSSSVVVNNQLLMMMGAPIHFDQNITGAIITCHKVKNVNRPDEDRLKEFYLNGHVARSDFSDVARHSAAMKRNIEMARAYAFSNNPVLIVGETGTEKELFAESIHNNSAQKEGPFINLNCSALSPDAQNETIFGIYSDEKKELVKKGALELAAYGTVLLQDIECLSMENQYLLYKAVSDRAFWYSGSMVRRNLAVRVIATTGKELAALVREGLFREDLYYLLSALKLELPPLRCNRQDIEDLTRIYVQRYASGYSRYTELTKEAVKVLEAFPWEGNLIQLEHFCERLVLLAKRRRVDEGFVRNLLMDTYPDIREVRGEPKMVIFKDPEAAKIADLLEQCGGSRAQAAKCLGISTTTLWRKMKKYGITSKYDI